MPDSAEAHSLSLTTNRNCVIEITNLTQFFCLRNPKVYLESGYTHSPPQPTVRSGLTEVCSFTKDDNTACGSVGVMTYELFDVHEHCCDELVAVMFSVPFDYNFYKNWLAVGIFKLSQACDESLYKHMYNSKKMDNFTRMEAKGSGLTFKGQKVDVRATMSEIGKAIVKLELYEN